MDGRHDVGGCQTRTRHDVAAKAMKLSSQEEYGLRCLLHLARQLGGVSQTIPEISQAEGVSHHNVGKMLRILRQGGFVESERGQYGGYALARSPENIIVADVLDALGGRLFDSSFCDHHTGAEANCTHTLSSCSVRALWSRLQEAVDQVLNQLTLKDLLHQGSILHDETQSELLEISS
ncbi:MAG: Rrf2 family protein [Candidatus Latescibacterota bacterium]